MQKAWKLGLVFGLILITSLAFVYVRHRQQAAYAAATPPERGWMLIDSRGCTDCHQADSSYRAPLLRGLIGRTVKLADGRTLIADAAYVRRSLLEPKREISAGYQGVMPTYEGRLSDEELDEIVAALSQP